MKISIEVSDFYLESEEELESSLKEFIKREVTNKIWESIKKKVETQIEMEVKTTVEQMLYKEMTKQCQEIVSKGEIKSYKNSSGPLVSYETYIREKFEHSGNYGGLDESIKKIADNFSTQIKSRYDLLFASQLVAKMSDNGLLKEDAIQLLLDKPKA